jgi:hypothetical protein
MNTHARNPLQKWRQVTLAQHALEMNDQLAAESAILVAHYLPYRISGVHWGKVFFPFASLIYISNLKACSQGHTFVICASW